MVFSKKFPKTTNKMVYSRWIEVTLSEGEEKIEEHRCRVENIKLIKECIEDAKSIARDKNLKKYQTDLITIATILFEKRASHSIYWKEDKAKEKFDKLYQNQNK